MADELEDYKEARFLTRVVEGNSVIRTLARRCLLALLVEDDWVLMTPEEYYVLAPVLQDRPDLWDQIITEICEQEEWEIPWGSKLEVRVLLPPQGEVITINVVKT